MTETTTLLTLAILATFAGMAVTQTSIGCFEPGECVNGIFITLPTVQEDVNACLEHCKNTLGCQYFTYFQYENNACFSMSSCPELSTAGCESGDNGCISGDVECVPYQCGLEGLCHGKIVTGPMAFDAYGCSMACNDFANCEWWSFDTTTNHCLLLETCVYLERNKTQFISSERDCTYLPPVTETDLSKVFVVGGYNVESDSVISGTEVLDMNEEALVCTDPAPYPFPVESSIIFSQDNNTVVCGGYTVDAQGNGGVSTECYQYVGGQWTLFGTMAEERSRAAGVTLVDGTKWVTGGRTSNNVILFTSELLFLNGTTAPGPELPEELEFHCMLQVTDRHVMVIGGYNYQQSHSRAVYAYNFVEETWTRYDDMVEGRYGHLCARVHSDVRGEEIIVTGGATQREKVEIFSLNDLKWRAGADVPRDVDFGQAIDYNDSFLALGGIGPYANATLEYMVDTQTWSIKNRGVNKANYDFAAIIVDSSSVDCN